MPLVSLEHISIAYGHLPLLDDADFYKESGGTIRQTLARLDALQGEVLDACARWNELDSRTKR